MAGYSGRNRQAGVGGPSGVQRSYASQLREHDPLFNTYEHLQGLPRGDAALTMLRKVASLVKPIMRKRNWKVQILAEFLPPEPNLLGLNINKGYKICIRLRYHNNPDLFLPLEQVVDTLLHELSHNIWGEHDANFHRLWDLLRDEHETLIRKGYTGEGFLSNGHRLGGGYMPPSHEMRRLARASAEKRQSQSRLTSNSGQRVGGTPLHLQGGDVRQVIADQIDRRNTINRGCGSGRSDAISISDQASNNTFKTKAEEDDANDRAIAQALYELMEEEEERKLKGTFSAAPTHGGLAWHPNIGMYDPKQERPPAVDEDRRRKPSEEMQMKWALQESMRASPDIVPEANRANHSASNVPTDSERSRSAPPPVPIETKPDLSPPPRSAHPEFSPVSPLTMATGSRPTSLRGVLARGRNSVPSPISPATLLTTSTISPTIDIDISEPFDPTSSRPEQWTCEICTCINPLQFLACDACGTERPQSIGIGNRGPRTIAPIPRAATVMSSPPPTNDCGSMGWLCSHCGAFMEHRWWTCSACGRMKDSS